MSAIIIKHRLFRIHCFNKYGKHKNDNCPDLEVTYYIECSEKEDLGLRESRMRREIEVPIICQQESIDISIPEKITTGLQEIAITTKTPNTSNQSAAPQEDSSTEQMMTSLNDGTSGTQEVEITTETSNTLHQWFAPQEDSSTEQMIIRFQNKPKN